MLFFKYIANDSNKVKKASIVHYRYKENCYYVELSNILNFYDIRRYELLEVDKLVLRPSRT